MASTVSDLARQRRRRRAAELAEVARVARSGEWCRAGHRSVSQWLAFETGESVGQCKVTARVAERLADMPVAAAAFAAGDLPESGLRLLADTWHAGIAEVFAADEAMLVRWVTSMPHHEARAAVEMWAAHADPDRHERGAQERFDARRLHLSSLLDGMHALDGLLDSEGARYLADALRLLSQRSEHDERTAAQRRADALVQMAKYVVEHHARPTGARRRRAHVTAVIDYDALLGGRGAGTIDGHVAGSEEIRRLCCDAAIHRLVLDARGVPLDYGRATRTISEPLFQYLTMRDSGCRFPGCTASNDLCDAHHARHWADHGATEPENLVHSEGTPRDSTRRTRELAPDRAFGSVRPLLLAAGLAARVSTSHSTV